MFLFITFAFADPATRDFFERSYREYFGKLLRIAVRRLGNTADAEDCVQDAFIRFAEVYEGLELTGDDAELAFLTTILKHRIVDFQRKQGRIAPAPLPDNEVADAFDADELAGKLDLRDAVAELPEPLRDVVILRYGHDLSSREVAAVLNLSVSAVDRRLEKAKKILERRVKA